jgi:hypothetical protein
MASNTSVISNVIKFTDLCRTTTITPTPPKPAHVQSTYISNIVAGSTSTVYTPGGPRIMIYSNNL